MPDISVSDTTVAAINKARDDQNAAGMADQDVTNSQGALRAAQDGYNAAQDKALAAHKRALVSAHAAVDALASDLGVPMTSAAQKP